MDRVLTLELVRVTDEAAGLRVESQMVYRMPGEWESFVSDPAVDHFP